MGPTRVGSSPAALGWAGRELGGREAGVDRDGCPARPRRRGRRDLVGSEPANLYATEVGAKAPSKTSNEERSFASKKGPGKVPYRGRLNNLNK